MYNDMLEDRFQFDENIGHALIMLSKFVEGLIQPSRQSANVIQGLARVLNVIRRFPTLTRGINGALDINLRVNEALTYQSVHVFEDEFRLSKGGSVYDPLVGHDTFSETCFYMQPGGYVEGSAAGIYDWLEGASDLVTCGGSISLDSINDTDKIDWEVQPQEDI